MFNCAAMTSDARDFELAERLDGNISRLLAAVAFLALSGYTLFTVGGNSFSDLRFSPTGVSATDVFFFLFNVGIFFALAFALGALESGATDRLRRPGASLSETRLHSMLRRVPPAADDPAPADGHPPLQWDFYEALVQLKTLRLQRCRAAIEFTMITMAMMGTARIPGFSQSTKFWLIAVALALYCFGPIWKLTVNDPTLTFGFFTLNSVIATGFLLASTELGARWWAIGYALIWTTASRISLPWSRVTLAGSMLWAVAGVVALVWFSL